MKEFLREFKWRAGVAVGVTLIFMGGLLAGYAYTHNVTHPADLCMEDEVYAPVSMTWPTPGWVPRRCTNVEDVVESWHIQQLINEAEKAELVQREAGK